ncbi:MFS transporter [Xanthobacter oligotrophicus]|uniref:MFS transporter n=1 Tax=Xanthobacter oligotrophicus TaxID=2607286 RepID=UPI0011F315D5|nr:aromatic acid/H+ symport family MFS transporter [Xanthobacter oligotrophicus]
MSAPSYSAPTPAGPRPVNIQQLIDESPVSRFQLLIIVLCFLIVAVDGFDTAAAAFIAPAIRAEWQLTPAVLGPMFGAGLFGLMVGALVIGPFADRFGRKPLLIFSVVFFGLASLGAAFSHSITELTWWRFVTGLGLGAAMPSAITLTSEYCPERKRSFLVTIMFCGFTLGSAMGGLLAAQLVAEHGWRSVLVVGGAVPLVVAVLLWALLPESIRFLVLKDPRSAAAARNLARIAPGADLSGAVFVGPKKAKGLPVQQLFSRNLVGGTLLLWLAFFMSLLVYYLLTNWLPTFINSGGASIQQAALITMMLQLGGTLGGVVLGLFMDKVNPHALLASAYVGGGLCVTAIGNSTGVPGLLPVAVFGAGFCIAGSQIGINALAAAYYPTASRATGVSWANGIGRSGSVVGSMVGGLLLSFHWGFETIFAIAAAPALVAGLAIFLKGRLGSGATLDATPVAQVAQEG